MDTPLAPLTSHQWFQEARFGMFIHWGVYSLLGRGEWVMCQERIPKDEYARLAEQFAPPATFSPAEWVALAREAGMRYLVLTTRHHDGFSLFDSAVSDFTSTKTAAGRDFVAEYVDACRQAGMRVGLYYSLDDWRFPAQFTGPEQDPAGWSELVEYVHAQVRELCSNYGKIDILWYDRSGFPSALNADPAALAAAWKSAALNRMVRELQPEILINDRSGLPLDFFNSEQHMTPHGEGKTWEACMTLNKHWGYFPSDPIFKHPKELICNLTACASQEGNYLLNIGPRPDGSVQEECREQLRAMGRWLQVHGDAVHSSQRCALPGGTFGCASKKGTRVFLHVHWWPGTELCISSIRNTIHSATILTTGQRIEVNQQGDRAFLRNLPAEAPDPYVTVIELEVDGDPQPGSMSGIW